MLLLLSAGNRARCQSLFGRSAAGGARVSLFWSTQRTYTQREREKDDARVRIVRVGVVARCMRGTEETKERRARKVD